jgi:TonB-dependent SusC/RagA subfamily outer membrane receptor
LSGRPGLTLENKIIFMITLAWYLLKVIICSGILCGYYYIALRNKIFHRWNRFYLLASVVLALAVPIMKIDIFQNNASNKGTVIQVLQTISSGDEIVIEYSRNSGLQLNSENIIYAVYLLITIVFLAIFFFALYKIYRLKKKYPEVKMKGINFISTDAKGTPFSFFKSIFWNNAIDLHSKSGQQIFNHEIAHVKEKHSYDKIFMNVVLIFFWLNPFFWLMRKELNMIHEFIADKESLEDADISAFAEMILHTVYPKQNFSLANNFFHSPLKRRIIMFTKNKNPKVSYISRLLALPLAAVIFFAFTLKMKKNETHYTGKTINVVIDAGHGGSDNGARENNVNEKDLNLAIAKEIKKLNTNENLNIILSRTGDETMVPQDRTKFAETNKADVFVSIHIDAENNKNEHNGMSVFIPKNDNPYVEQSQSLGSAIVESFKSNYLLTVSNNLQQRERGIWILKANEWPSVLIQVGYLSTQRDFDYLTNPKNQRAIAQNILNGIEKYAEQNLKANANFFVPANKTIAIISANKTDSLREALFIVDGKKMSKKDFDSIDPSSIESITILKGESGAKVYGSEGKNGVVIVTKKKKEIINTGNKNTTESNPIYFVDGKEISKEQMKTVTGESIKTINVLKGEEAVVKYGKKGKNGVIEMVTRKENIISDTVPHKKVRSLKFLPGNKVLFIYEDGTEQTLTKDEARESGFVFPPQEGTVVTPGKVNDKVFTKVENESTFPGGRSEWTKYITSKIQDSINSFTEKDYGTCVLKFIVNTDGSINNVEATTMEGTELAKVSVDAIKNGPKWIPAMQNGHTVAAYRLQPVTLTNPDAKPK